MATENRPSFWKRTSGKIVIAASIIAGVAALLNNLTSIGTTVKNWFGPDKEVPVITVTPVDTPGARVGSDEAGYEITRVDFTDQQSLDIQFVNNSSQTVLVTRADLFIRKRWKLVAQKDVSLHFLPSSHTYDVSIILSQKAPYTSQVNLHQAVAANEADRFTIRMNSVRKNKDHDTYIYLADIKVITSGSNTPIVRENVLFGFENLPVDFHDAGNRKIIQEIRDQPGEKGALVNRLIKSLG